MDIVEDDQQFWDMGIMGALIAIYLIVQNNRPRQRRQRRWGVRPIFQNRQRQGFYHNLLQEMRLTDPDMFFNFTRMSVPQFDEVLALVGPLLTRRSHRTPLNPEHRLAITLRYLATGSSLGSIAFAFRVGKSTASAVIKDTCKALWTVLQPLYLVMPSTFEEWEMISNGFYNRWNFPHCVGALDGKHVTIQCPPNTGSMHYNYKHTFSIVLLAVCDSNYRFTMVDIGAYGSQSDGGILAASNFGKLLEEKRANLPPSCPLPHSAMRTPFPYVLTADEAFPLKEYIMRPYPGKHLNERQRIFNYRLSRARRTIENAFGILVARWRVFCQPINSLPETVELIVQATVCLHNYLKSNNQNPQDLQRYCPPAFIDREEIDGTIRNGHWHEEVGANPGLQAIQRVGSNNSKQAIFKLRDDLSQHFLSPQGQVDWQWNYVRRGQVVEQ